MQIKSNKFYIFIGIIISIELVLRIYYLINGGTLYITSILTIDDSYYFFETAWNTKKIGLVTFDTLNKTNGVQFLWFWVLFALSLFFDDKYTYLYAIMILILFMNIICYYICWKIGMVLESKEFGILLIFFWNIFSFGTNFFMTGMENTLHILVIWVLIYYSLKIIKNKHVSEKDFIIMVFFLIFNVWTRYDSVIFSIMLYFLLIYYSLFPEKIEHKLSLKYVILSLILSVVGGLIQFSSFYCMGDSIIPVSAQIKLHYSKNLSVELFLENIISILAPVRNIFVFRSPVRYLILSLALVIIYFFFNAWILIMLYNKQFHQNPYRPLVLIISLLTFSNLIYSIIIANLFKTYYYWYISISQILFILISSKILISILHKLDEFVNQKQRFNFLSKGTILPLLILSISLYSTIGFFYLNGITFTSEDIAGSSPLYTLRYDVAIWLRENTMEDAIIGSWNSGQLGFFSDRHVVNLDGLINHISYYRNILCSEYLYSGNEFASYLDMMNISFIVDYRFYGFNPELYGYIKVKEFSSPFSNYTFQIWNIKN